MESRTKILAVASLVLILLFVGSYWVVSGRAANNVSKDEAMRLGEEEINRRSGALDADAISANKENDEDEGSNDAYYDVIVKNSEGYWEVEVNCDDGSIGEVEGPDSKPDRE